MADIYVAGLLLLNESCTQLLLTRSESKMVPHWILPCGSIESGESSLEAMVREVKEELACDVDVNTVNFIGEYEGLASGRLEQTVNIQLFKGKVLGTPKANEEIVEIKWFDASTIDNPMVSEIIKDKIIPDLLSKKILLLSPGE